MVASDNFASEAYGSLPEYDDFVPSRALIHSACVGGVCCQVKFRDVTFGGSGVFGGDFSKGLLDCFVAIGRGGKRRGESIGGGSDLRVEERHGFGQFLLANAAFVVPIQEERSDQNRGGGADSTPQHQLAAMFGDILDAVLYFERKTVAFEFFSGKPSQWDLVE